MQRIAILGSTGSIGENTLGVIKDFPQRFTVAALTTNTNINTLCRQVKLFRPLLVGIKDGRAALDFKSRRQAKGVKLFVGEDGLREIGRQKGIDKVVLAISGAEALPPLLTAIESGKDIATANKEAIVIAGSIIMRKVREKKINFIPIDSEQSAVWQCLEGEDKNRLKNIYLTASGGPFLGKNKKSLRNITAKEALRHPRWKMGKKITIDSATLMNKGLEVLEAMYLFGLTPKKIKVVIHPQSIIHSLVEFVDGVVMAQLSVADMRIPIQYALTYPQRLNNRLAGINFYKLGKLNFDKPDPKEFPCLKLAYQAAGDGGTAPCVLNAANETAVEAFLSGKLGFLSIPRVIEKVLGRNRNLKNPGLSDIYKADTWARQEAERVIGKKHIRLIVNG